MTFFYNLLRNNCTEEASSVNVGCRVLESVQCNNQGILQAACDKFDGDIRVAVKLQTDGNNHNDISDKAGIQWLHIWSSDQAERTEGEQLKSTEISVESEDSHQAVTDKDSKALHKQDGNAKTSRKASKRATNHPHKSTKQSSIWDSEVRGQQNFPNGKNWQSNKKEIMLSWEYTSKKAIVHDIYFKMIVKCWFVTPGTTAMWQVAQYRAQ